MLQHVLVHKNRMPVFTFNIVMTILCSIPAMYIPPRVMYPYLFLYQPDSRRHIESGTEGRASLGRGTHTTKNPKAIRELDRRPGLRCLRFVLVNLYHCSFAICEFKLWFCHLLRVCKHIDTHRGESSACPE